MKLYGKIVLLITLVVLSTGICSSLLVSRIMYEAMERELEEKAMVVAQTTAEHITHNVINGEVIPASEALREIVRRTKDVDYIFIVGFEHEVFAHSFEDGFPKALVEVIHEAPRADTPQLRKYLVPDGSVLDVGYPLIDGMIAHLHIGMNESHAHNQVAALRNWILCFTLIVGLLGIGLGGVLSRRITRPLGCLADSLRDFGRGKIEEEIDIRGGGQEVADLTRAFNRMFTERKRAEEALRESEAKLSVVLENIPAVLLLVDTERRVHMVNNAAAEFVGRTSDEMIGLRGGEAMRCLHSLDDPGGCGYGPFCQTCVVRNTVLETLETGISYHQREAKLPFNIDGKTVELSFFVSTARLKISGRPMVIVCLEDITEHKKAEEKLLEYQARLKHLASELTLVEERERHRIATELHDQIAQSLVVSKLELEVLRESVSSRELHKTLGKICDSLGQTIQDTRSLTSDLSSPILHELGFREAVADWLVEQIQEKHGIASEFEDDGQPKPLDDDLRAVLFRDVRELLLNVVKHAHAHKVKVSTRKVGSRICVSVEDDGIGFDPGKTLAMKGRTGGFGLFSIRERLEELGGYIEIDSEPNHGAKITLVAPLKQEKANVGEEV